MAKDALPKHTNDFVCCISFVDTTGYHEGKGLFSFFGWKVIYWSATCDKYFDPVPRKMYI